MPEVILQLIIGHLVFCCIFGTIHLTGDPQTAGNRINSLNWATHIVSPEPIESTKSSDFIALLFCDFSVHSELMPITNLDACYMRNISHNIDHLTSPCHQTYVL